MRKRLPYEAALLAALLLGSCSNLPSQSETHDLADVANVNARNALYKIQQIESRLDDMPDADDAELEVRRLRGRVDDLESELSSLRETVNNNADAYNRHISGE